MITKHDGETTTRFHMCMSVRGVLNWPKSELRRGLKYITKDDGSSFASTDELCNMFMDELAKGHEVIPMGECDNFDWKKGCQGHRIDAPKPGTRDPEPETAPNAL